MSRRSGLSRLEDLKRGFVDIGRYRYILHKFDMELWRDWLCPVCNFGFGADPTFYMSSYPIHNDCFATPAYEKWVAKLYDETYEYESADDAYNNLVLIPGLEE